MIASSGIERTTLIEAGKRLACILREVSSSVSPGVSTETLDALAESLIRAGGDEPAFLGYTPGAKRPFPATLCVSINDEIVHGIPNEFPKILKDGDIVGLDLGLSHKGMIVDAAVTVPVGTVDAVFERLIRATKTALEAGIAAALPGNHVGDMSHAIQTVIEDAGYTVVRELGGHGVGKLVHEDPFIPNFGSPGEGPELVEGMVLALEPIATAGKAEVVLSPDGYTYRTRDGARSSHHEHTILIEKEGARIITAYH